MTTKIRLDDTTQCQLESNQVSHICPTDLAPVAKDQLAAELRSALKQPLNFPPLAAATVPGDRAVVALEYGIPQCAELLRGAIAALQDAGVERSDIQVLLSNDFQRDSSLQEELNKIAAKEEIAVDLFDPNHEQGTALLGVTRNGNALRLSRILCDADLVLSIGLCKLNSAEEKHLAKFGGIYPVFSDQETLDRFRAPIAADSKVISAERQNEIEEAGWMLGAGLTIQVVPNPTGEVAALYAGDPASVAQAAADKYHEIWRQAVDDSGDLLIATIPGDTSQQTWQNLGRVLELAEPALEAGGVLVLWTHLAEAPGGSLQRLAGNDDVHAIERELMRDRLPDSWPAMLLCRALQRGTVYIHSELDADLVESLGLAPLADTDELERLSRSRQHCIVMEQAQWLLPEYKVVANELSD